MLFNRCHFCGSKLRIIKNDNYNNDCIIRVECSNSIKCDRNNIYKLNNSKLKLTHSEFRLDLDSGYMNIESILNYKINFLLKNKRDKKRYVYSLTSSRPDDKTLFDIYCGYNRWDNIANMNIYFKPDGTKEFYINLFEKLLKMKAFA